MKSWERVGYDEHVNVQLKLITYFYVEEEEEEEEEANNERSLKCPCPH